MNVPRPSFPSCGLLPLSPQRLIFFSARCSFQIYPICVGLILRFVCLSGSWDRHLVDAASASWYGWCSPLPENIYSCEGSFSYGVYTIWRDAKSWSSGRRDIFFPSPPLRRPLSWIEHDFVWIHDRLQPSIMSFLAGARLPTIVVLCLMFSGGSFRVLW